MSEKNFWKNVRDNLPLKMYRVENSCAKGMPDVHFIQGEKSGWIELKFLEKWPRDKINSGLTLNQSMWSKEYRKAGGLSYVLLRIGREFTCLIVDSEALYNRPSRKEFMELISWGHEGDMKKSDWDLLASRITCQDYGWQKLADRLDCVINHQA